jgi:hypothetical protein
MLIITQGKYFCPLTAQHPAGLGFFCVIVPQDPPKSPFYFSSCDLGAPSFAAAA